MASNDSGVDTSNDSTDSSLRIPSFAELASYFENNKKELESFGFPSALQSGQHTLPSGSHSLKMRPKSKNKARIRTCRSILADSNERKLRIAASTCNTELLTTLLQSGVDPNCYDDFKRSPLHLAACRGYTNIVSELLKYGANPNIVDSLGNTPMHLAVISASSMNFNLVVRILLQAGASVHAVDKNGKNPLELAQSKLRLMRCRYKHPNPDAAKVMEDMCLLIAVILRFFCKEGRDIDELAALEERLQNLSTKDQVANEADTLLASVERLSITK